MKTIISAETSDERELPSKAITIGRFFTTHWMLFRYPGLVAVRSGEHARLGMVNPISFFVWNLLLLLVLSSALPLFAAIDPALNLGQHWDDMTQFIKDTDTKDVIFRYSGPIVGLIIGIAAATLGYCILNITLYKKTFALACYAAVTIFNAVIFHFLLGQLLVKLAIATGFLKMFFLSEVPGMNLQYVDLIASVLGYPFLFMLFATSKKYGPPGFVLLVTVLFITGGCMYSLKTGNIPFVAVAGTSTDGNGSLVLSSDSTRINSPEKTIVKDSIVEPIKTQQANSNLIHADTIFTSNHHFSEVEESYAYVNNFDIIIQPVTDWQGHAHIKLGKTGRRYYMHFELEIANRSAVPTKLPNSRVVNFKLQSGRVALREQSKRLSSIWKGEISLPIGSSLQIQSGGVRKVPVKKYISEKTYKYLLREAKKERFGINVFKVELIMGEADRKFLVNKSMAFVMEFVDKGEVYPEDVYE